MKEVHLVICDLFLPKEIVAQACADLRLPALEKMLARSVSPEPARTGERTSLEKLLCEAFDLACQPDAPIAPISAAFDGLGEGCWLRADPVHLRLQRDQLVLLPDIKVGADEAGQLCAALNAHFADQGVTFHAPHPQRWYVRVDRLPDITTVPLSLAAGRNVRNLLPAGKEAAHWHRVFNEIQMLLFSHPVNEAREVRGELPVNSLWLWGGGCDTLLKKQLAIRLGEPNTLAKSLVMAKPADCGSSRKAAHSAPEGSASPYQGGCCDTLNGLPKKNYACVSSDEALAGMFAAAAHIPSVAWQKQWRNVEYCERQLLVCTGLHSALQYGSLEAWRAALQEFEVGYAQPLWLALRAGKISRLQLDILSGDCVRSLPLTRTDAWAFWRRARPLAQFTMM